MRAEDFLRLWEPLTWHRDGPVSEASDVAVHRLAELAGEHVKVVLSGEGADELFAGYPKHRYAAGDPCGRPGPVPGPGGPAAPGGGRPARPGPGGSASPSGP